MMLNLYVYRLEDSFDKLLATEAGKDGLAWT